MTVLRSLSWLALAPASLLAGCHPLAPTTELALGGPNCARSGPLAFVGGEGDVSTGSVYLAIADNDVVLALDPLTLERRASIALPGGPARILALDSGDVAVALRDVGEVVVLPADLKEVRQRILVGERPGAMTRWGDGLLVPVAAPIPAVVWLERQEGRVTEVHRTVLADDEPRAVLEVRGPAFVVSHAQGLLSTVDAQSRALTGRLQLREGGRRVRHVDLLVPQGRSSTVAFTYTRVSPSPTILSLVPPAGSPPPIGYYGGAVQSSVGTVYLPSTTEAEAEVRSKWPWRLVSPGGEASAACSLGEHASFGQTRWVVALKGAGSLQMFTVPDGPFDTEPLPSRTSSVGVGVDALAMSPAGDAVFAWNPFDMTVTRISVDPIRWTMGESRAARVGTPTLEGEEARGRVLFHSVEPDLTSAGGIACASCHPDGGADGVTWVFPEGPRQTQPLWGGILDSAPFHWDNLVEDFHALNEITVQGRMGGTGLSGEDLDALAAFLDTLPEPSPPADLDEDAVERGRKHFESEAVGCAACHAGRHFTDGLAHDVGTSVGEVEGETLRVIATPTLHGLAHSAPYLHDGSAPTLIDVVERLVRTDRMGTGSHLSDEEVKDLVTYLQSL